MTEAKRGPARAVPQMKRAVEHGTMPTFATRTAAPAP